MKPTKYIRDLAKIETERLKSEVGDGFRGGTYPLTVAGWFMQLDHTCTCKLLVYKKDDIKLDYNP